MAASRRKGVPPARSTAHREGAAATFARSGAAGLRRWFGLLALLALPAWAQEAVHYDWFDYRGHDATFAQPLPPGHYRNPVLAGFYPDPAVTRAGDRYYLVNSSFAYFPGLPLFESRDLVHWKQIGSVIDRPGQMDFDGQAMSRGLFAASIAFHDGTFYVVGTAVDGGGNFIVSATDPAGPWSDPAWLRGLDGIDPSLFFDDDGKVYLLNNGPPQGPPLYEGHRAIWMQQLDLASRTLVGPRRVLLNGGVDLSKHPVWIEGPHLYKRDGWYYLSCAEGGTSVNHSQVVLRSRSAWGPYQPYRDNPILTQRDLPADRADPVINAGHADLVEGIDGHWWAVFLASRSYGEGHFNTGRETWLLPVQWKDGWPTILAHGRVIPRVAPVPAFADRQAAGQAPLSGNFDWHDDFDQASLDPAWLQLRAPKQPWADLAARPGELTIHPLPEGLDALHNPSFLARRQQHLAFDASTALDIPARPGTAAGLAAFQNESHWYFLGVHRVGGQVELFLQKDAGGEPTTVARTRIAPGHRLKLKIAGDGGAYSFAYDADGNGWRWLRRDDDATILSTDVAGGFIGTVLGPYARTEATR